MSAAHIGMVALGFCGFVALALGMERHAKHLLNRTPGPRFRRLARAGGWLLLAAALALGIATLETSGMGIVFWFGWLSLAALLLVFALPEWPWQPRVPTRPERAPRSVADDQPIRAPRRWIGWALLAGTLGTFFTAYAHVDVKPLARADAIRGSVGPWAFTLAETDREGPEIADMNVPLKAYRLRFCESCDAGIARAYLKVNRPRTLRASGMAFSGNRWEREVEVQLPSNLTGASQLWLTVVGKDGRVHHASWPMRQVSPATVDWFAKQARGK